MRELDELIEQLERPNANMEDILIKAQVVASKLDDEEFSAWVQAELEGYEDDEDVPSYRKGNGTVMGTVSNGFRALNNQPIALFHLGDDAAKLLTQISVRHGVGVVASHAVHADENARLGFPIPPEVCADLSRGYANGYQVVTATLYPGVGLHRQILTQIRTRLLRLALASAKRVASNGEEAPGQAVIEPNALHHLLAGASISQSTVNIHTGNSGTISSVQHINAGDREALMRELGRHGVDNKAAADLDAAIAADDASGAAEPGQFGQRVRGWLVAAGKGAGKAASSVATRMAIEAALHAYFGH